jgi:carboxypeptidase C (cathepsin A)
LPLTLTQVEKYKAAHAVPFTSPSQQSQVQYRVFQKSHSLLTNTCCNEV